MARDAHFWGRPWVTALVMAVVLYFGVYGVMEHLRTRNGPWAVSFRCDGTNAPSVIINEPRLGIRDFEVAFPGQRAGVTNVTVVFDHAREVPFEVPFGRCIFQDAMSEPGTVTLALFGHEVQLITRTLTVDGVDYGWQAGKRVDLRL